MIRGRRPMPTEDDGLQTDVMRFMAIIAFCLIAILALVRQVEPETTTEGQATPHVAEFDVPSVAPIDTAPLIESEPKPERVASSDTLQGTEARPETREREPQESETPPEAPSAPSDTTAANADEGLVLRFASDSDFLRLVNSGRLEVFAFGDAGVLKLEPGLTFQAASAPGTVYELLPETLPAAILSALATQQEGAAHDRWGMRMPPRLESQIRAHLRHATHGALIIDRNGDVRHAADG